MRDSVKVVVGEGETKTIKEKKSSSAAICERISKVSLYLLVFLMPLLFLPWTANVLEFNKQALLIFLVFISVFAWLLNALISGAVKINLSFVHIPVAVLFVAYLVSTILSLWKYGSFWGWPLVTSESLATVLSLSLLYFLVANILNRREVSNVLSLLVFSGALSGIYAVFQVFGKFIVPIGFTQSTGFNTIGSLNVLAIFSAVLLPLAMMLLTAEKKKSYKIMLIVSAAVFSVLIFLINFYVAWWLVVVGAALMFIFGMQRRDVFDNRWLIIPMFFLAVGLLFSFFRFSIPGTPQMPAEFFLKQSSTLDIAKQSLRGNPVFGTGPGTFSYIFLKYKNIGFNQNNDLWSVAFDWGASKVLTVLATVGIIGALSFVGLIIFFVVYGIIFMFKKKEFSDSVVYWRVGVGAFISFLTASMAYFFYSSNITLDFAYFLFLACFVSFLSFEKKEFELKPSSLFTLGFTFAITLIFVFGLGMFILEGQRYVSSMNYLKGITLWQAGDTEKALSKLENSASISPGVDVYWRELGRAYLQQTQLLAGREDLSQEQKMQAIQSVINKAVNSGKAASDTNPANVANWVARGFVYQSLIGTVGGTKDWAVDSYKEAMNLDPVNPDYPTQAGMSVLMQAVLLGNEEAQERNELLQEAESYFSSAIELKPDYANAHFQLARVYFARDKQDEMIVSLEKARNSAPFDVGLAFQLGLVYYQKGDLAKARGEFESAVMLNPNYSNALYFLGLTYYDIGEKEPAVNVFERILQLNPDNELVVKVLDNMRSGREALAGVSDEEPAIIPIEEEPAE